jgi:hypothetical protein
MHICEVRGPWPDIRIAFGVVLTLLGVFRLWLVAVALSACATLPDAAVPRALYRDLRTVVDANEDGSWIVDRLRLPAIAEPALRSVCQVEPAARAALKDWLDDQIARAGGSAQRAYAANGRKLSAVSNVLSLERTRALLQYAEASAAQDCPFWLTPDPEFIGHQGDAQRWVVLGETQAFATLTIPTNVPALGGGGRLFVGHGIGSQWTLALGGDVAASGTLVSGSGMSQGIDATVSLATPVLLRLAKFSSIVDVELAPVVRLDHGRTAFPPGARIELGGGFTTVRDSAFVSYFMLYVGYEFHPHTSTALADHTLQLGTRLALDWAP